MKSTGQLAEEDHKLYTELTSYLNNISNCQDKSHVLTTLQLILRPENLSMREQAALANWKSEDLPLFRAVNKLRGQLHGDNHSVAVDQMKQDIDANIIKLSRNAVKQADIPRVTDRSITELANTMSAYLFEQSLVAVQAITNSNDAQSEEILKNIIDKAIAASFKTIAKNIWNHEINPEATLAASVDGALTGGSMKWLFGDSGSEIAMSAAKEGLYSLTKNKLNPLKALTVGTIGAVTAGLVTGGANLFGFNKETGKIASSVSARTATELASILYDAEHLASALTTKGIKAIYKGIEKGTYDAIWQKVNTKDDVTDVLFQHKMLKTFGRIATSYIVSKITTSVAEGVWSYFTKQQEASAQAASTSPSKSAAKTANNECKLIKHILSPNITSATVSNFHTANDTAMALNTTLNPEREYLNYGDSLRRNTNEPLHFFEAQGTAISARGSNVMDRLAIGHAQDPVMNNFSPISLIAIAIIATTSQYFFRRPIKSQSKTESISIKRRAPSDFVQQRSNAEPLLPSIPSTSRRVSSISPIKLEECEAKSIASPSITPKTTALLRKLKNKEKNL